MGKIGQVMSQELKQLLSGLLAFNPDERLMLGERAWALDASAGRRGSVWDAPWLRDGPSVKYSPDGPLRKSSSRQGRATTLPSGAAAPVAAGRSGGPALGSFF